MPAPYSSRLPIAALGLAALLLLAEGPSARAQAPDYNTFAYDQNFPNTAPLRYSGGASDTGPWVSLAKTQTYGAVYDTQPVKLSQGFLTQITPDLGPNALDVLTNGAGGQVYGVAFVIKNPADTSDVSAGGAGFSGLNNSIIVNFVPHYGPPTLKFPSFKLMYPVPTLGSIEVWAPQADGTPALLTSQSVSVPNLSPILVRYSPTLKALDIFSGAKLLLRVPNFDLTPGNTASYGAVLAADGTASVGVTSGRTNNSTVRSSLSAWDLGTGEEPVGGSGANSADVLFPFSTSGQSLWGTGSDVVVANQAFKGSFTIPHSALYYTEYDKNLGPLTGFKTENVASIGAGAKGAGDAGIDFVELANGGTVAVNYPVHLHLSFPQQYTAKVGHIVPLTLSYAPDLTGSMTTTTPTANVQAYLDLNTDVNFDISAHVYSIVDLDIHNTIHTGTTPSAGSFLYDSFWNGTENHPNEIKLFDLYDILTSGLIPGVDGGTVPPGLGGSDTSPSDGSNAKYSGSFQGKEGAEDASHLNKSHEKSGDKGSPLDFVQFSLTIPNFGTSTPAGIAADPTLFDTIAQQDILTLSSDFTNDLVDLIPDIGEAITSIPIFNNDYSSPTFDGYGVSAGVHLLDLYGSVSVGGQLEYQFQPNAQVYLDTDDGAGKHKVYGPYALKSQAYQFPQTTVNDVVMPSSGVLHITPIFSMKNNTFSTTAKVTLDGSLKFNPAAVNAGISGTSYQFNSDTYTGFPYDLTSEFLSAIGHPGFLPYALPWGLPGTGRPFPLGTQSATASNPTAAPFPTATDSQGMSYPAALSGNRILILGAGSALPILDSADPNPVVTGKVRPTDTLPLRLATANALPGAVVQLDHTTSLPTDAGSPTDVHVQLPGTVDVQRGVHTLTLFNTHDSTGVLGEASNDLSFTVTAPVPRLDSVAPVDDTGVKIPAPVAGSGDFRLVASGRSFSAPVYNSDGSVRYAGTTVQWNGHAIPTTFGGPPNFPTESLIALVPAGLIRAAGSATLTVETDGPGGGVSNPRPLLIDNPTPTLTALSPRVAVLNGPALSVSLDGTNFTPDSTVLVSFGGGIATTRPTQFVSPTRLTATLLPADLLVPGLLTLTATSPNLISGGVHTSSGLPFRVALPGAYLNVQPLFERSPRGVDVLVVLDNLSAQDAQGVTVTSVQLNHTLPSNNSVLPSSVGLIPVGQPAKVTDSHGDTIRFVFPASVGVRGAYAMLTIIGTLNNKPFTLNQRIALP